MQPDRKEAQLGECECQPSINQCAYNNPLKMTLDPIAGLKSRWQSAQKEKTGKV